MGHYKFKDVTAEVGLNPHGWSGDATFADVNGDGWPDILFLNMQGADHYFENEGGKKFVEKTAEYFPRTPWGAMGVEFFDYDNDGRMDLIVTDMMTEIGPTEEKEKVTTPAPDAMLGAPANNFIFGNGKSGYLSQSALPLYFGLGDATKIDSIEVIWPSRRKQVVSENLQENQTLTITEPAK